MKFSLHILFIFLFMEAQPATVQCPIDGVYAGWSGKTRERENKTECQYRHVHIHMGVVGMVDEKHEFWMPCEVKTP